MSPEEQEEFPPTGVVDADQFETAMHNLVEGCKTLGIDPDSLLKCSEHNEFMFDPNNHFHPTIHYQHHIV